ncbi:OmpA family protein [Actinoplanes hulinensis]|uniref:OmpA family protein n=1 Tax=Actinoplanes hulinensis TaxID=1144547 RepID=A0ABS7B4A9_9ACTN|nr:OmpA family protein [Actinoplanes hulinensis]MBW6435800.1 OmpA family protein [Actinoplanes hulinensis]
MVRRGKLTGIGVVVAVLVLGGCTGPDSPAGGGDSSGPSGPSATAASSADPGPAAPLLTEPMSHEFGPAYVDLVAVSRTAGTVVTARFRVVNDGGGTIDLTATFGEEPLFNGDPGPWGESLSVSGAGLLDPVHNKLYLPLSTEDGTCLCSSTFSRLLKPGESAELYAMFPAPPADVTRVTVTMPLTVPFQDVTLGSGPVGTPSDLRADPATARLRAPRILAVTSQSDGDVESVTDSAENRSVRLSSDVLFALNKADLTAQATAALDKVAGQINASTATAVKVDGHTDTTGNDAINEPLSRRRAEAVAGRLKTLVTRPGVTFQVAGHGSAEPVASNADEAGRRKNRRVTVAFIRPVPGPAPTPASPAAGMPYRSPEGAAPTLATATFPGGTGSGLVARVNGLHRDASGLTTLVWTVENTGSTPVDVSSEFEIFIQIHGQFSPHRAFTVGGVLLVDPATKTRHYPLTASSGQCLCTTTVGTGEAKSAFNPGESSTYSASYELPPEVGTVEVWFPWTKGGYTMIKTSGLRVG